MEWIDGVSITLALSMKDAKLAGGQHSGDKAMRSVRIVALTTTIAWGVTPLAAQTKHDRVQLVERALHRRASRRLSGACRRSSTSSCCARRSPNAPIEQFLNALVEARKSADSPKKTSLLRWHAEWHDRLESWGAGP